MVPDEKPKTNENFASREKICKWKTGIKGDSLGIFKPCLHEQFLCDNFYVTNVFGRVDETKQIFVDALDSCFKNYL